MNGQQRRIEGHRADQEMVWCTSKSRWTRCLLVMRGRRVTPRQVEEGCLFGIWVARSASDDGTTEVMTVENSMTRAREDDCLCWNSRLGHGKHVGLAFCLSRDEATSIKDLISSPTLIEWGT